MGVRDDRRTWFGYYASFSFPAITCANGDLRPASGPTSFFCVLRGTYAICVKIVMLFFASGFFRFFFFLCVVVSSHMPVGG